MVSKSNIDEKTSESSLLSLQTDILLGSISFLTIVKFHWILISSSEHFGLIRCCGPEVEPDSHKVEEFSEDSNQ